jgi:methyl-accepting chemotaxis protein
MVFFENINSMISQVAQAVQEQTKGGDLIFKAAKRMEQVAQQVKRATKEQTLGSKQITRRWRISPKLLTI